MRRVIVVLFIVSLIFLSGCVKKQESLEEPLCNKPYFEYMKGQCCLDSNDNKICDKDETTKEAIKEEGKETVVTGSKEEFIKELMNNVVTIKIDQREGSGFFIDKDGYVITNYHVIFGYGDGESNITVKSYDSGHSSNYNARVLGYDYAHDIAVLKVDSTRKWGVFPFAEKTGMGDTVYALGSPFDYEFSASKGIISAKNREGLNDRNVKDYLQTDASINPGNSGGPLVNENGELVGLNTFGVVPWWGEGLNFALESKKIKDVYYNIRYIADLFDNPKGGTVINKNFNEKMNIFLKEIKVRWDENTEKGYLVSFDYIAQNKDLVEHNICFNIIIMKGGMIVSNQLLDKKIKLTAGMQKLDPEQIVVNSEFEGECSNYHFEITSMDCESKEIYSRNIMKQGYYKKIPE